MISLTLDCVDCGYTWKPRKKITRYRRQCPKCKCYNFKEIRDTRDIVNNLERSLVETSSKESKVIWPKIVYDLMGILEANSPENALHRTYELYRRLLPYKYKYDLESLDEVFKKLETTAIDSVRKAREAKERLGNILKNPDFIFYEAGGDLTPVKYYEALKKTGYQERFLDFLTEIVSNYFRDHEYSSPEDFLSAWNNRHSQ